MERGVIALFHKKLFGQRLNVMYKTFFQLS